MRPSIANKYNGGFVTETAFFKGGGGGTPMPTNPMAQANADIKVQQAQAEIARQQQLAAQQKADADKLNNRNDISARVGTAYNQAQNYGTNRLQQLGINDQYGILDAYHGLLDNTRAGLSPDDAGAPAALNGTTLFDTAYNGQRSAQQSKLKQALNAHFGTGFDESLIGDTADDSILNAILGTQQTDAAATLQRAKDRGQINEQGYGAANTGLGNQAKSASAKLQDLGLGVIGNDRKALRDAANGYFTQASNYDFGDTLDPNAAWDRVSGMATGSKSRLEGDIYNALGDTNYFDTNSLLAKAGTYQGATGATGAANNPLAAAFSGVKPVDDEKNRLLGTQGSF